MIKLRLFYMSTPFLISPKGERLPRFQSLPCVNSEKSLNRKGRKELNYKILTLRTLQQLSVLCG
jgi:hypothetical protein